MLATLSHDCDIKYTCVWKILLFCTPQKASGIHYDCIWKKQFFLIFLLIGSATELTYLQVLNWPPGAKTLVHDFAAPAYNEIYPIYYTNAIEGEGVYEP